MLIPCPWCGDREDTEFTYGGAAGVGYPNDQERINDADWASYLFVRPNLKGELTERWAHAAGCRRWFTVLRDTVSHEIRPAADNTP
ncbi:MAG: sarcosine oxidase, subunit delta [Chloroflexota bacterium]|jgi:heterotetrameric sarcosine oxidase delta subunit|nr:sarcosine oxidase, subunit delta [Chloroflexota bacterium]